MELQSQPTTFTFTHANGSVQLDAVEIVAAIEKIRAGKTYLFDYAKDVVAWFKLAFQIEISVSDVWQLEAFSTKLWIEFKKKQDEKLTSLFGTDSTPGVSMSINEPFSIPNSPDSMPSEKSSSEEVAPG